jgi:ABC-type branched-subunit amino acid transport system ATPase component
MPEPLLEFRGVRASYEEVEVIHGVNATFEEGVVTAVLGANGAGNHGAERGRGPVRR